MYMEKLLCLEKDLGEYVATGTDEDRQKYQPILLGSG
jgi:hypothetical protein